MKSVKKRKSTGLAPGRARPNSYVFRLTNRTTVIEDLDLDPGDYGTRWLLFGSSKKKKKKEMKKKRASA